MRERIERLLELYGIDGVSEPAAGIEAYLSLLKKWNARVNLTAATGWEALEPLVGEAVWAASFYPETPCRHLDVGSGAGFPSIPLRILRPKMRLTMVEPRARKASFLETAAEELGLCGTTVYNGRLEELLRDPPERGWDAVSWKAVRLGRKDLALLARVCGAGCRYWVFHGPQPPFEAAEGFELSRRERFPGRERWFLSILRSVSRETGKL